MSTISASTTSTTAYKVTADTTGTLVLQTGSTPTTAVTIDTSQKVGIGTSSPSNPLTVQKANGGDFVALFQNTTSATPYCVWIKDASSSTSGYPLLNITDNAGTGTYFRVDSSTGNVGIGTSSPVSNGGYGGLSLNGTSGALFSLMTNGTESSRIASLGNETSVQCKASTGYITFVQGVSGGTERARIDSSGNFIVGATSPQAAARMSVAYNGGAYNALGLNDTSSTAGVGYIYMQINGTTIGSIVRVGSGSTVAYNTSSDYRLKEDVQPMVGALEKVSLLKPVTYKWKADGSHGQGFIAHEIQEVVPDCVTGEKDAVDEDGKPVYQGMDVSFLVATLTAAIQELKAELDAAKADIATLKGAA